jgi:hypothetical protein
LGYSANLGAATDGSEDLNERRLRAEFGPPE